MRKIKCINENNISLEFAERFSPFLLLEAEGLYEFNVNVNMSDISMGNGAIYEGSNIEKRNIVLYVADYTKHWDRRNQLYQLFKPHSKGILIYTEDENSRQIEYYVESVLVESIERVRKATVSLLCPDPFFSDLFDVDVIMNGWKSNFEFPHQFIVEKEQFGIRINKQIETINNDSIDDLGMEIIIRANGEITNPSLRDIYKGTFIKVGTISRPLNMKLDDVLIINTCNNAKNVYLNDRKINNFLDEDSTFLQLSTEDNVLRYDADSGVENMLVTIRFRKKFLGV